MKITLDHIGKSYGKEKVLSEVNLEVKQGQLLSILGESGAGKTTILRILAGLVSPDNGRVLIDGQDVTAYPLGKRDVGYIFQAPLLFPHMTVNENISFGLEVKNWAYKDAQDRISELFDLLQIRGLENRMPSEISGGQQQRVAIARALAPKPSILLMDEPFSSLDPKLRAEMGELLKTIQQTQGITIIFVTHDRDESLMLSDSIALLIDGEVAQNDTPEKIFSYPKNKKIAKYMGECNFIKGVSDGKIFRTSIGNFNITNGFVGKGEMLLRPYLIKIDESGSGYFVKKSKTTGKDILYYVSNDTLELVINCFSDTLLELGQEIGIILPSINQQFFI